MRSVQIHPPLSAPRNPITGHQRAPKTRRDRKIMHTPPRAVVAAPWSGTGWGVVNPGSPRRTVPRYVAYEVCAVWSVWTDPGEIGRHIFPTGSIGY